MTNREPKVRPPSEFGLTLRYLVEIASEILTARRDLTTTIIGQASAWHFLLPCIMSHALWSHTCEDFEVIRSKEAPFNPPPGWLKSVQDVGYTVLLIPWEFGLIRSIPYLAPKLFHSKMSKIRWSTTLRSVQR